MVRAAQGLVERTVVTRLRVSFTATRIHDRLREIGLPKRFAELLQAPGPVLGVELTRPFFPPYAPPGKVPPDNRLWSMLANDKPLSDYVNASLAKDLRRAGVPLRHRVERLAVDYERPSGLDEPYAEAHVHPFGIVGIATVELGWDDAVPVAHAWQEVSALEGRPASATVAGRTVATTVREVAGACAGRLLELLAEEGGREWSVPDYRLATVIAGTVEPVPSAMPADSSELHGALHHLSGGSEPLAAPKNAFAPRWSGADFRWEPMSLVYMLDRGLAALSGRPDPGPGGPWMGDAHRRLTLLVAHLTASVGLIKAHVETGSPLFKPWADDAANRLARLYGPAKGEFGPETRRYLTSTGTRAIVEAVRGTALSETYSFPDYP